MDSASKKCICDEHTNIKPENKPFLMYPRSSATPSTPIEPATAHRHLCCPENCPPNDSGQCESKWDVSKPIISDFVNQSCPQKCTCTDANDASVTHDYICGNPAPSACGTCTKTCTDNNGVVVTYNCDADKPSQCDPEPIVVNSVIPPTLGGIPSPIDAITLSSYNIHGAPAFTSVYSIGRADRPSYICFKNSTDNTKKIWEPRYHCPDFRGNCARGKDNCPCINIKTGKSISGTFCEYANMEPLRNEGKSSTVSTKDNSWEQAVSTKAMSVIVRTSPPR